MFWVINNVRVCFPYKRNADSHSKKGVALVVWLPEQMLSLVCSIYIWPE